MGYLLFAWVGTGHGDRLPPAATVVDARCRASYLGTHGPAHGLPRLKAVRQVTQHCPCPRTHVLDGPPPSSFPLHSLSLSHSRAHVLSLGNAYISILSTQHGAMYFLHKDHSAHLRQMPLFPHASVSLYVRRTGTLTCEALITGMVHSKGSTSSTCS